MDMFETITENYLSYNSTVKEAMGLYVDYKSEQVVESEEETQEPVIETPTVSETPTTEQEGENESEDPKSTEPAAE